MLKIFAGIILFLGYALLLYLFKEQKSVLLVIAIVYPAAVSVLVSLFLKKKGE